MGLACVAHDFSKLPFIWSGPGLLFVLRERFNQIHCNQTFFFDLYDLNCVVKFCSLKGKIQQHPYSRISWEFLQFQMCYCVERFFFFNGKYSIMFSCLRDQWVTWSCFVFVFFFPKNILFSVQNIKNVPIKTSSVPKRFLNRPDSSYIRIRIATEKRYVLMFSHVTGQCDYLTDDYIHLVPDSPQALSQNLDQNFSSVNIDWSDSFYDHTRTINWGDPEQNPGPESESPGHIMWPIMVSTASVANMIFLCKFKRTV